MSEQRREVDGEVWSKVVGAIRYNPPGNDYETKSAHQDAQASSIASEIIALVRADERKQIREALLTESDGFIVARRNGEEPEAAFATKPWMVKILAAIGLTGDADHA